MHHNQFREIPPKSDDSYEYNTYLKRLHLRHVLATKAIGVVAAVELLYASSYQVPILLEEQRLADTQPVLHHISDNPDFLGTRTVVLGGFAIKDASPIARALPQLEQLGSVDAIEYDNRGIDAKVIARQIIESAEAGAATEREKPDEIGVGLWLESAAGFDGLEVARIIQEDLDTPVRISYIFYDCMPADASSLRDVKKDPIDVLQAVSAVLPKVRIHPLISYAYYNEVLGPEPAAASGSTSRAQQVVNYMYNPKTPSSALLTSQALAVLSPTPGDTLQLIADVKEKDPPIHISFRPAEDQEDNDETVITSDAEPKLRAAVIETGMTYVTIRLRDIIHADPTVNRKQYQEALENIVIPIIKNYDLSRQPKPYTPDGAQ